MTFTCDCKGTTHSPHCGYWKQPSNVQVGTNTFASNADDAYERDVLRKLERIIVLLEEIAGRRR